VCCVGFIPTDMTTPCWVWQTRKEKMGGRE
jgi:hypothetical protein